MRVSAPGQAVPLLGQELGNYIFFDFLSSGIQKNFFIPQALICRKCETIVGAGYEMTAEKGERVSRCRLCRDDAVLGQIDVPYIFRYLVSEFASCNISLKIPVQIV